MHRYSVCLAGFLTALGVCRADEPRPTKPPPLGGAVTIRVRYANPAVDGLRVAGGGGWRLPAVRAMSAVIVLGNGQTVPLVDAQGRVDSAAVARDDARAIRVVLSDPEGRESLAAALQSALLRTPLEGARFVEPAPRPWSLRLAEVAVAELPGSLGRVRHPLPWAQVSFERDRSRSLRTLELPIDASTRRHLRDAGSPRLRIDLQVPYDAGPGGAVIAHAGSRFFFPEWVVVPGVTPIDGLARLRFVLRQSVQERSLRMGIDPDWVASERMAWIGGRLLEETFPPVRSRGEPSRLRVLAHPNVWVGIGLGDLRAWALRPEVDRRAAVVRWIERATSRSPWRSGPGIQLVAPGTERWAEEAWLASLRGPAAAAMAEAIDRNLVEVARAVGARESRSWVCGDLAARSDAADDVDMIGYGAVTRPIHGLAWIPLLGDD